MPSFGAWEPDKLDLDGGTSRVARNVYAKGNSYGPVPSAQVYGTATLPAKCVGFASYRTGSGGWGIVAGTKTALYKYTAGAWVVATRLAGGAYNVPTGDLWSFAQFGSQLIACNVNDDPQVLDVETGANFTLLAGSPPKSRIVKGVQDFVWMVGQATLPYAARWSDLNDATQWTAGLGTALSDVQFFPTGGRVMNVTGGYTGFVFQEQAVRAFEFTGPGLIYRFQEIDGAQGCIAPYAVASMGAYAWYLGERGFNQIGPDGPKPIGATRVDDWWRNNTDASRQSQTLAVADPVAPRILFACYATASSTTFDVGLIYDWQLDRWTEFRGEAQMWAAIATPGTTLEALNSYGSLEDLPFSLDSRVWEGNKPTWGGMTAAGALIFMAGSPMAATIASPRAQVNPGSRAFVSEVRPVVDTDAATLRIGTAGRVQDALSYSGSYALDATGKYNTRASGRVFEFELTIPAGTSWSHAQGLDVVAGPGGAR